MGLFGNIAAAVKGIGITIKQKGLIGGVSELIKEGQPKVAGSATALKIGVGAAVAAGAISGVAALGAGSVAAGAAKLAPVVTKIISNPKVVKVGTTLGVVALISPELINRENVSKVTAFSLNPFVAGGLLIKKEVEKQKDVFTSPDVTTGEKLKLGLIDIAGALATGLTVYEVAKILGITVEGVRKKLGFQNPQDNTNADIKDSGAGGAVYNGNEAGGGTGAGVTQNFYLSSPPQAIEGGTGVLAEELSVPAVAVEGVAVETTAKKKAKPKKKAKKKAKAKPKKKKKVYKKKKTTKKKKKKRK